MDNAEGVGAGGLGVFLGFVEDFGGAVKAG